LLSQLISWTIFVKSGDLQPFDQILTKIHEERSATVWPLVIGLLALSTHGIARYLAF
jgi:hypothetical protein